MSTIDRVSAFVLWACCLGLGAIAVAFLVDPVWTASQVEIELPSPAARTDVRAVYGGFQLGLAAFWGWCARRPERFGPGLLAAGLGIWGFGVGRVIGIALEGGVSTPIHWGMLGLEWILGPLLVWLWWRRG